MRNTSIGIFMLTFLPFVSEAATSITIDSQRNCLTAPSMDTLSGTSAKFSLEQGRYVLSLVSNSMNCTSSSSNSCPIDTVMVQGGFKILVGASLLPALRLLWIQQHHRYSVYQRR